MTPRRSSAPSHRIPYLPPPFSISSANHLIISPHRSSLPSLPIFCLLHCFVSLHILVQLHCLRRRQERSPNFIDCIHNVLHRDFTTSSAGISPRPLLSHISTLKHLNKIAGFYGCRLCKKVHTLSPWLNKYYQLLEDGSLPSTELRKLEIEAKDVFAVYRDSDVLYFSHL